MELHELRSEIDRTDAQLVELFLKRMELCKQIAVFKNANGLPLHVPNREAEVLAAVQSQSGPEMAEYTQQLFLTLFQLSKEYQYKATHNEVK